MNVTMIGTGYVGLVTGAIFAEKGHHVLCIDNNEKKVATLQQGNIPFYEPGLDVVVKESIESGRLKFSCNISSGIEHSVLIFVAVGTPPGYTGEADMSYIEKVARDIAIEMKDYKLIVEKSTVPVRTGERIERTIQRYAPKDLSFDVASNPEFLREGQALEDARHPDRIVIGVRSKRSEQLLEELYRDFNAPIIVTDVKSAEIIKHAANSFLAMKISYINAVANICELAGANICEVARGIGLDKRISPDFLSAGVGYGGSCFPKDVDAFVKISEELGYEFDLLKEVQKINKEQRMKFIKKIREELWVINDKTIGLLGVSFKPETDDMREAPSLDVIVELKKRGAKVRVYDPQALTRVREILQEQSPPQDSYDLKIYDAMQNVTICDSLEQALTGADCMVLLTEWQEFKEMPLDAVKSWMQQPLIIDGRNVFDSEQMKRLGFIYRSIGR